jgi:hypothetical protein
MSLKNFLSQAKPRKCGFFIVIRVFKQVFYKKIGNFIEPIYVKIKIYTCQFHEFPAKSEIYTQDFMTVFRNE